MSRAPGARFLFAATLVTCGVAAGVQLAACGTDATSPGATSDASDEAKLGDPDGSTEGSAPDDGGSVVLPTVAEVEPNDGPLPDGGIEAQNVTLPSHFTGAIDPADDIDVLSTSLAAGELWTWTLDAKGSSLVPHLGVTEFGNKVPAMVATAAAGGSAEQEHFVLEAQTYFAVIRDLRNVGSSSQHVGGAGHTWELTARKTPRAPIALVIPSTAQGMLRTKNAIAIYSFTLTQQTGFDIELKATRKSPPSNIDSRMSLFDATKKKWLLTNGDISGSITDSKLGGVLPPSDYVLVVENVDPAATDLSFELGATLR